MKQERYGLDYLPKRKFRLSWTECYSCGLYFKFEFMYYYEEKYLCKECCKNFNVALLFFKKDKETLSRRRKILKELEELRVMKSNYENIIKKIKGENL